jgi:hypothetical protein
MISTEVHYSQRIQLLVTANIVPSMLILFALMIGAVCSFQTSDLTGSTLRQTKYLLFTAVKASNLTPH